MPFFLVPLVSLIWALIVYKVISLMNMSIKPDHASLEGGSSAHRPDDNSSFNFFYFYDLKQYRKFVIS